MASGRITMVLVMPAAYCLPWSAAIIWLKPTGVAWLMSMPRYMSDGPG